MVRSDWQQLAEILGLAMSETKPGDPRHAKHMGSITELWPFPSADEGKTSTWTEHVEHRVTVTLFSATGTTLPEIPLALWN